MHSHTPSLRMISARLRLGLAVAFCLCLGLGLVAISAGSSHLPTGLAPELTDSPASAERLERALESVMTLEILEQNAAGGWRLRDTAAAIVISSEGHVVTLHSGLSIALSASGQMKSQVRLRLRAADGQSYRAKWLGSDPELDLALLAILDRRGQSFQALPVKPERQPLLGESFVQILPRNPFRHQGQLIAGHCEQILPVLLSESGQHYALFTSASLINKSDLFAPAISRDGAVIGFRSTVKSASPPIATPTSSAIRPLSRPSRDCTANTRPALSKTTLKRRIAQTRLTTVLSTGFISASASIAMRPFLFFRMTTDCRAA